MKPRTSYYSGSLQLESIAIPALALAIIALAAFFGLVLALEVRAFTLAMFGIAGGLLVMVAPLWLLMMLLVVVTFAVAGTAGYFARMQQAQWLPYMLAMVAAIRVPLEWRKSRSGSAPLFVWMAAFFILLVIASGVANQLGFTRGFVAGKLYVFMWCAFLLVAAGSLSPERLAAIWRSLLLIAVLQLPIAMYQRFFIAAGRRDNAVVTSLDAVVGTFGGNPDSGGYSGALAVFLVSVFALALCLYQRKQLSKLSLALVTIGAFGTFALAEVKIVVILVPIAVLLVYIDQALKRPLVFIAAMLMVIMAAIGLGLLYYAQPWQIAAGPANAGGLERWLGYVFDPTYANRRTGEVSRLAMLNLWWSHPGQGLADRLIGFGPAASHISAFAIGDIARLYLPLRLNASTIAGALWDVGVLGVAALISTLALGALTAWHTAREAFIPAFHQGTLKASAIALVMILIGLPYNNDMITSSAIQLLAMLTLGCTAYWVKQRPHQKASHEAHVPIDRPLVSTR